MNKMYFQYFPEPVRPKTIITRNVTDVKAFYEEHKGRMVMKPLQGSGGRNVFAVGRKEEGNINQMFEAISRDGYVIAQEYLPDARDGDIRLFLMNGNPIMSTVSTARCTGCSAMATYAATFTKVARRPRLRSPTRYWSWWK